MIHGYQLFTNLFFLQCQIKAGRNFRLRIGMIFHMCWKTRNCINGPCQIVVQILTSFTSGCAMGSAGTQQTLNRHSTGTQQSLIKIGCFGILIFKRYDSNLFITVNIEKHTVFISDCWVPVECLLSVCWVPADFIAQPLVKLMGICTTIWQGPLYACAIL